MNVHSSIRTGAALALLTVALPAAAATPQSAVDELLAADRAFSAASAKTDLVSGLTAMFAEDVVVPTPPGQFAEGKAAIAAALRANPDNAQSRTDWTPVRGGVSADGQHGFTAGFMTIRRGDSGTIALKYLAYWVKRPEGWRVVAYKRVRAGEGSPSPAALPPALPAAMVAPTADAAVITRHRDSLDKAERSFSDESQTIGLGAAFAKYGSADALNLAGGQAGITVGNDAIAKLVANDQPLTAPGPNWAPDTVIVASSGDLGVTIGMIHPKSPAAGQPASFPFFTIWRRVNVNAPWRYVAE